VSKLPRSLKAQPLNRLRLFDDFTRDADRVLHRWDELLRISRVADHQLPNYAKSAALNVHDRSVLTRCEQALDVFNSPDCYDDGDNLCRDVISFRIALIVGSFPSGAPCDPEIYVSMLIEHVDAVAGLSLPALDAACREITATQKFLPSVSEVLALVNEQNEKWWKRLLAIDELDNVSRALVARIASSDQSRAGEAPSRQSKP
jgi:hypothetical protein